MSCRECHYRSVFGAHVAWCCVGCSEVCASMGRPDVCASLGDSRRPRDGRGALTGLDVAAVTADHSPRTLSGRAVGATLRPSRARTVRPCAGPPRRVGGRRPGGRGRAHAGVRPVRRGAEQMAMTAAGRSRGRPELPDRVATYRGGYLPERRALETAFRSGRLTGMARPTLSSWHRHRPGAVVIAGFPAQALWQQLGRAGREDRTRSASSSPATTLSTPFW